VRKTTKLTEGGHRGLQDYRHICYYFSYDFFQNPSKNSWLFTFFCRVLYVFSNYGQLGGR